MGNARVVLTDSGGIQEETTILGVSCLIIRNNTERQITIQCGTNTVVGTNSKDIIRVYNSLPMLRNNLNRRPLLWDGRAAARIIDILENLVGKDTS